MFNNGEINQQTRKVGTNRVAMGKGSGWGQSVLPASMIGMGNDRRGVGGASHQERSLQLPKGRRLRRVSIIAEMGTHG